MITINCEVVGDKLEILDKVKTVKESVNHIRLDFNFDESWDGLTKTVYFTNPVTQKIYPVILINDACIADVNAVKDKGYVYFALSGERENYRRMTNKAAFYNADTIYGGHPSDLPSSDIYDQILAIMQDTQEIAQSVRDDADSGKFDGEQGPEGPQGDPGQNATNEQVKTAVDAYFTENPVKSGATEEQAQQIEQNRQNIEKKLDKDQGEVNAGKFLVIGDDGLIAAVDAPAVGGIVNQASGAVPLVVEDSSKSKTKILSLQGWTEQDSTTGAQLLNYEEKAELDSNYYSVDNGNIIQIRPDGRAITDVPSTLKLGAGEYTWSIYVVGSGSNNRAQLYNKTKNVSIGNVYNSLTFTLEEETEISFKSINTENTAIIKHMVNFGNIKMPWEPYTGGQPSPSPEYPQDIFNAGTYNEETGKYEYGLRLTGKNLWSRPQPEEWTYSSVQPGYSDFKIYVGKNEKITFSFEKKPELGSGTYCGIVLTNNGDIEQWLINNVDDSKNTQSATLISKEDFIWVRAYSQGIEALLNNFPDFQIEYGEKRTGQSVTLTSDRPLTKWDRLVKKDGVWGWEYGGKEIVVDGKDWRVYSHSGFSRASVLPESMNRRSGFCNLLTIDTIGVYNKYNTLWIGVNNTSIYTIKNEYYRDDLEDNGLSDWGNFLSENNLIIHTYTDTPDFVPLSEEEQQLLKSLVTYYPTTVISNDQDCEMSIEYVADTKMYIDKKFEDLKASIAVTNAQLL